MPTFLWGALPLLAIASSPVAQDHHVAYADFGHGFLQELGENEPPPLTALLDKHYARLLLQEFDLRLPSAMLAKPADIAEVATIAEAMLDLQDRLSELTIVDTAALKARQKDTATLRKFVAAWRNKPTTPPPAVAACPDPCILIAAPTRKNFVGLVGYLGLWKKNYQDDWWNDGTAQFCDLTLHDEGQVQILTLEYAAPKQDGDVTLGFDMNTREHTGLLQHVLQRASVSWCVRTFGDDVDPIFLMGFATDLVVDVLGENNARSGGSGKSSETEGRGAFVPMAPSAGGSMEMVNADSKWRLSLGKDWFARVLRQAQKAGEHEAKGDKDKLGHFLLQDQKNEKQHLVHAPFLGTAAFAGEAVPAPFLDDYLEFHRAYRAAFVHWLQLHGGKSKANSNERFAQLLQLLTEHKGKVTFETIVQQVYELPLSSKDPEQDTLERRLLAWIASSSR